MSKTIDERVVEMRFDNKQFESNVQTSLSTIEKLKKSLDMDGATKGLESIDSAAKKVAILEHTKQTEIDAYRYEQRGLCAALAAVALGKLPACVVKHGGEYHKQHIHRLSPRIEQQAECEQYSVPPCLWRNEIRKQAQRKEALQKRKAGEYHT